MLTNKSKARACSCGDGAVHDEVIGACPETLCVHT